MIAFNPDNERNKKRYFLFLREAKRLSEISLDGVAHSIARFERFNGYKDFKLFHVEQAVAFKRFLSTETNKRTEDHLSKATIHSTLRAVKDFFLWLAGQPGFRSRLSYSDAEYFNLSEKDSRVARAKRELPHPSIEQIMHVLNNACSTTAIEMRNRAIIAFTLLTGARDSAIISAKLKHVDLSRRVFNQDARDVRTKFSKSFVTVFFPVQEEVEHIVSDWIAYLSTECLWGPNDPLFPASKVELNAGHQFECVGLERRHWSSTSAVRAIFKQEFQRAGLPYFNPHSFRKTLTALGEKICGSAEEFKAWSQNLGHERVLTTLTSYGQVSLGRQAQLIAALKFSQSSGVSPTKLIERGLAELRRLEELKRV